MYALVLAGGRGERLRPLTDTVPKPMVLVCGKPILWHQVQWLRKSGVTDICFLAGYRWEAIKEFFGDGSAYGFHAHYSVEETPLGRGGAIRKAMTLVPETESYVAVTNGDIITAESLDTVVDKFRGRRDSNREHRATIMVVPFRSPYGLVDVNGAGQCGGISGESRAPLLDQCRDLCLLARYRGTVAGAGRPRDVHVPRPGSRGKARRGPVPGLLAER